MKKLNLINKNIFFCNLRFFVKLIPPHATKYEMTDFAPSNKPIMTNKLPSNNLERFLRRIKSPLTP